MNTTLLCRASPFEATLHRLRETFYAGQTRPAEFRTAQLQGLGRFLQDNKQLLQDALAKDLGKVLYGGWMGIWRTQLCPSQAGPHPL